MVLPTHLSTRQAVLELVGAGHTARMARRLLDAGLAGESVRGAAEVAYETARVLELADRRHLARADVDGACPHGLFVARRLEDLEGPWDFSYVWRTYLRVTIAEHGPFPMVVALSSVVVRGADVVQVRPTRDGRTVLDLAEPGPWFETFRERRCATGPGRAWALHLPFLPRVGESAA